MNDMLTFLQLYPRVGNVILQKWRYKQTVFWSLSKNLGIHATLFMPNLLWIILLTFPTDKSRQEASPLIIQLCVCFDL